MDVCKNVLPPYGYIQPYSDDHPPDFPSAYQIALDRCRPSLSPVVQLIRSVFDVGRPALLILVVYAIACTLVYFLQRTKRVKFNGVKDGHSDTEKR